MAVFKVNSNFTIIANPEAVKLVPELASLTDDEFWYVAMVVDYVDSPLRKKPYEERQKIAKYKVFGKAKKVVETKKVKIAMEAYKSLVFDIRRETVDNYKAKISFLNKELLKSEDVTSIKKLDSSIEFLMNKITTIEHSLSISEEESIDLKGGRKLSELELWQRNQMAYEEHNKE